MCFSAQASFTTAIVLTIVGYFTFHKLTNRNLWLLACIPFIFAFQQVAEGFLWLTISSDLPEFLEYGPVFRNIFLFIAIFIWPVWIPLSFFVAEEKRSILLTPFLLVSLGYVAYTSYALFNWQSIGNIQIEIFNQSIQYIFPLAEQSWLLYVYLFLTMLPPFFSSLRGSLWLALTNVIAFFIAYFFYTIPFISIWCFFAAWVSITIYGIIYRTPKTTLS